MNAYLPQNLEDLILVLALPVGSEVVVPVRHPVRGANHNQLSNAKFTHVSDTNQPQLPAQTTWRYHSDSRGTLPRFDKEAIGPAPLCQDAAKRAPGDPRISKFGSKRGYAKLCVSER